VTATAPVVAMEMSTAIVFATAKMVMVTAKHGDYVTDCVCNDEGDSVCDGKAV